ncbi:hypothetical protein L0B52_07990 [Suttonella sp. R2A3]|uniref:hypothetical protein n=1 Tax=Suttonella sp. R2A3 TaxID=2908648 RepID=UPI001F17D071|nr:hypothetical protein [Suttonella sp. R2A3]UJF24269.1 hypothetical protein L0B52_07990 [Suttonella sp. R2A3]
MSSSINRFIRLAVLVSAFIIIVAAFLSAVVVWPEYVLYREMGGVMNGYYQQFIIPSVIALGWWIAAFWLYLRGGQSRWFGLVLLALCWLLSPLVSNLFPFLSYEYSESRLIGYLPVLPKLLSELLTLGYLLCYIVLPGIGLYYCLKRPPSLRHALFNGLLLLCLLRYLLTLIILASNITLLNDSSRLPGKFVSEWLSNHTQSVISHYSVWPALIATLVLYLNVFVWRDGYKKLSLLCAPLTLSALIANLYMTRFVLDPLFYILAVVFALYFYAKAATEKSS